MSVADIFQQTQSFQATVLGGICFAEPAVASNETTSIPLMQLSAPILDGAEQACELWLTPAAEFSGGDLKDGSEGAIRYRYNDDLLFGIISLPESASLQDTAEQAYQQIFALLDTLNYLHIYRFWNYMAEINVVMDGLERYRQFNIGRRDAMQAHGREATTTLPAACALGLAGGPLSIAFLAGRQASFAIENPRQISAYEYPEQYGPRPPSFSRATLVPSGQNQFLLISGTASIVGHQTLHPSDVIAQTRETLLNLQAIIDEANRLPAQQKFELKQAVFRVYIRHAADLSAVRNEIYRQLGSAIKAVFIQADICREELLLEIEAAAVSNSEQANP